MILLPGPAGDFVGAIAIAVVLMLLTAERLNRGSMRFHQTVTPGDVTAYRLRGRRALAATAICSLPLLLGFLLPALSKHELFRTIVRDGALARKTFSMGEADEKRFYLECRRIA